MARVKVSTVVHTEDGRHVWLSAGDEVPEDLVSLLAPALLDEPQNESVSPEVEESDLSLIHI